MSFVSKMFIYLCVIPGISVKGEINLVVKSEMRILTLANLIQFVVFTLIIHEIIHKC